MNGLWRRGEAPGTIPFGPALLLADANKAPLHAHIDRAAGVSVEQGEQPPCAARFAATAAAAEDTGGAARVLAAALLDDPAVGLDRDIRLASLESSAGTSRTQLERPLLSPSVGRLRRGRVQRLSDADITYSVARAAVAQTCTGPGRSRALTRRGPHLFGLARRTPRVGGPQRSSAMIHQGAVLAPPANCGNNSPQRVYKQAPHGHLGYGGSPPVARVRLRGWTRQSEVRCPGLTETQARGIRPFSLDPPIGFGWFRPGVKFK